MVRHRHALVARDLLGRLCCEGVVGAAMVQPSCWGGPVVTILLRWSCCDGIVARELLGRFCCDDLVALCWTGWDAAVSCGDWNATPGI